MIKLRFAIALAAVWPMLAYAEPGALPGHLRLPPGFSAEILVKVPGARSMALGDGGTLFVGTQRGKGDVYAVRDPFGTTPQVVTIATGLKMPNGIAFRKGDLYIAEPERILRLQGIEKKLENPPAPEVVIADLPYKGMLHSWKYLGFGPDGKLYVPIGAPCNICNEPGYRGNSAHEPGWIRPGGLRTRNP